MSQKTIADKMFLKNAGSMAILNGAASKKTDINRDTINACASARGLKGVAMIAVDSDWSAHRFKRA